METEGLTTEDKSSSKVNGLSFMEAVEAMKQGKKVSRPKWSGSTMEFHILKNGFINPYIRWSSIGDDAENHVSIDLEKMEAEDYFIVEEKKPFVLAGNEKRIEGFLYYPRGKVCRAYDEILKKVEDLGGIGEVVFVDNIKSIFGFEKEEPIKDKLQKEVEKLRTGVWKADKDLFPENKTCSNGFEIRKEDCFSAIKEVWDNPEDDKAWNESECEHESDGLRYDSCPPKYRCKKCGVWY